MHPHIFLNMQKIIQILTLTLIVAWLGITLASANSGINYLTSQQQPDGSIGGLDPNGWAVMAFASQNQKNQKAVDALKEDQCNLADLSATSVERQILALVAAGENPRTFAGCNAVSALTSRVSNNQIGNANYLNDDMFGILALKAAKEPIPSGVISNLIADQNSDGGWGLVTGGQSSTDMTAMALIALEGAGLPGEAKVKAFDYIRSKQNNDGGFATFSGETNLASTTWVDWMIATLGESESAWAKNGNTPRAYIASQQLSNGSWLNGVLVTSYSLIALSGKGMPIYGTILASPSPSPSITSMPSPTPSPSVTMVPSPTPTPQVSATLTPTPTATPVVSSTPSLLPSASPSPLDTHAPNAHPSPTHSSSMHSPAPSPTATVVAVVGVPTPIATSPSPVATAVASPSPQPKQTTRALKLPPFVSRSNSSPSVAPSIVPSPTVNPAVTPTAKPSPTTLQQEIQKPYGLQILIGFILLFLNIVATIYELYQAEKRTKK